ncbi:ABC transporter permease [Leptolyngbya sp. 'hensonii']|uniref:FtsX-like permease family protein n=1 Tax=Leptolyngbya sp. 'hensonii' TaxID=1922337 RepID=UPI00094FFF1F|nr:FtsX-like permease family protein [Leptolyngbya sp. 'hensonii']OLP17660.1 ABC transporter permease [Leptolyngbya sp. 'hensonii']
MASIARKNLLEDIPRFLVAQAGIMFAVSLVTIQTGLQGGFNQSSSMLIDQSRADIWVGSENMEHLGLTLTIPYDNLTKARKLAGVETAEAILIRGTLWKQPAEDKISSITLIGATPNGLLFSPLIPVSGSFDDLRQPYTIITDKTNLNGLNVKDKGGIGKINRYPATITGLTEGTKIIVFDNLVFTSLQNANTYTNSSPPANPASPPSPKPLKAEDPISYVLIKAKPGQDLNRLKQRLDLALPDTKAYTRAEISQKTQIFWQERSGIGFILGLGAVVGVIVGIVIVGQILYSSVSDHLKEFGTLKAMGASNWFIYSLIIEQALWMAILGYVPGIAICSGVASWTAATQGLLILITPTSAVTVFGITVLMCVASAVFAIQKVTRVDPAIVFKS